MGAGKLEIGWKSRNRRILSQPSALLGRRKLPAIRKRNTISQFLLKLELVLRLTELVDRIVFKCPLSVVLTSVEAESSRRFTMLVLSRKEGERLMIGDDITLVISKISGNRVSIGIEAPKGVKIVRSELTDGALPSGPGKGTESSMQRVQGLREFAGSVLTLKRQVG